MASEDCEREIKQMLGWLSKTGVEDSVTKRLALSADARRKHDWTTAVDLCWQVINQAKSTSRISGNADSMEGWGRMYLGAAYYCKTDFAQALDHFDHAQSKFSLDWINQRVARFARGAACAKRSDRTGFDQAITPGLLADLRAIGAREAENLYKTLESNFAKSSGNAAASTNKPTDPTEIAQTQRHSVERRPIDLDPDSQKPTSIISMILLGVIILGTVIAFAFAVKSLAGTNYAFIAYIVTWAIASYFLVRWLRHVIPPNHALIIEKSSAPTVILGPKTYYRWPFVERAHALVPLGPLQYTSPKKTISLTSDEAVEVRVAVYYGVMPMHDSNKNVLHAVYNHHAEIKAPRGGEPSKGDKPGFLDVNQIKQKWERRLLSDIVMALNEVLPGWTRQWLSGDEAKARIVLINWLRERLEQRVSEWGMVIEELNIIELNKAKA